MVIARNGHNELGIGYRIAGDVAGEGVHIFYELSLAFARSYAADNQTEPNADSGRAAHEGAEHEFAIDHAVESRPVQLGEEVP